MADRYLTLSEVACRLRMSYESTRGLVTRGVIKGFQVDGPGSVWRIDQKAFRDYLMKQAGGAGNNTEGFKEG